MQRKYNEFKAFKIEEINNRFVITYLTKLKYSSGKFGRRCVKNYNNNGIAYFDSYEDANIRLNEINQGNMKGVTCKI